MNKPIRFMAKVVDSHSAFGKYGRITCKELGDLIGKEVEVTVKQKGEV